MTLVEADLDRTVVERVDARIGTTIGGRYRIDYKIAAGGFGAVYHAFDTVARRDVAIKVLHSALITDDAILGRFRREVAALAQLSDPHTVVAYDAGDTLDGSPYLVMELLAGESLHERFRRKGALPWPQVVAIARGVCSALAEAHALGIVHRDLTPSNIHVEPRPGERDFAKVLDFGIAKLRDGIAGEDITRVGQMIGTCDYMPPEQMAGTCVPQSDIFTLGVVMYELISGKRPFGTAHGPAAQLAAVLGSAPDMLDRAPCGDVPPQLARIVARCLDRDADARYANGAALGAALALLDPRGATKLELEAPTVPARPGVAFAQAQLEGPTDVSPPLSFEAEQASHQAHLAEIRRTTLPGIAPQQLGSLVAIPLQPIGPAPLPVFHAPARGSRPGSDLDGQNPFPPAYDLGSATNTPVLPPAHGVGHPEHPDQLTSIRWAIAVFIVMAIAVGIAIGIGFAS